jgi:predicted nucleic acid-binding protein
VDCVLDASVGIKLFVMEALSDQADALFAQLTSTPPARFYVPDLFFVECANTLWKYTWRFGYPAEAAARDVADLLRLPLRRVSTGDLVEAALGLAVAHAITLYDAMYVALAQRLSLPLVTADAELVRRVAGTGPDVRFLGDWP